MKRPLSPRENSIESRNNKKIHLDFGRGNRLNDLDCFSSCRHRQSLKTDFRAVLISLKGGGKGAVRPM